MEPKKGTKKAWDAGKLPRNSVVNPVAEVRYYRQYSNMTLSNWLS